MVWGWNLCDSQVGGRQDGLAEGIAGATSLRRLQAQMMQSPIWPALPISVRVAPMDNPVN